MYIFFNQEHVPLINKHFTEKNISRKLFSYKIELFIRILAS